jgi:NTE family protein
VAFEIARRHRYMRDLAELPASVTLHVMPTGQVNPARYSDLSQLRYRDTARTGERIQRAYEASGDYLAERGR